MSCPVTTVKSRNFRWITVDVVRHWRSGKLIRRADGNPFKFRVYAK